MGTQTLQDMTSSAIFRVQLYRLKVFDVGRVEEHVSDGDGALMNFDRMASENDAFRDDSSR